MAISITLLGQAPQQFNYQAVLRNNGNVIVSGSVSVRFTIHDGSPVGSIVYQEAHTATTDAYGLVNVAIGNGTLLMGDFSTINWGSGAKYLQVEVDNGAGYTDMGTQQILSVPYALYAGSAEGGWQLDGNVVGSSDFIGTTNGEPLRFKQNNQPAGFIDGALTAFGLYAMYSNTTGSKNTAFGWAAMSSNTSGYYNTAIGQSAMSNNSTGYSNTVIGQNALYFNTTGHRNTAIGQAALFSNSTGSYNSAFGPRALFNNTTGNANSAFGEDALFSNTMGNRNTAIGQAAMYYNSTGDNNTAMGQNAMSSNTTGDNNTAIGYNTLFTNSTGQDNVAVGHYALYNNTASENTAVGFEALENNNTGQRNSALGYIALNDNTTGDNNTAVGIYALEFNAAGNNNTALGYSAYSNSGDYTNSVGLGYDAEPSSSNEVRVGNSAVSTIGGYAAWTQISDGRFKTGVKENVAGLDFILKLRPVTYHLNMAKLARFNHTPDSLRLFEAEAMKEAETQIGFIAQEVEAAAEAIGFDFHGVVNPKNETSHYGLRYAEFVAPLVKAVQEQQDIIETQQKKIAQLQYTSKAQQKKIEELHAQVKEIAHLKTALTSLKSQVESMKSLARSGQGYSDYSALIVSNKYAEKR